MEMITRSQMLFLVTVCLLLSNTMVFGASRDCESVVAQARDAYQAGDSAQSWVFATEGISLCQAQAVKEQKKHLGLGIWVVPTVLPKQGSLPTATKSATVSVGEKELNAIGTAHFIRAEILKDEGKFLEAKKEYQEIIRRYPGAYQQGYQGWFWQLAELAQDAIAVMGTAYDFGDYQASILVKRAWEAFYKKDIQAARLYANKCLRLYDAPGLNYKNEVAVAHFLLGKIHLLSNESKPARAEFRKVVRGYPVTTYPNIRNYPYFNNITRQAEDYLALIGTPYDFGNYSSETLTVKAWQCWDRGDLKGVELYANKCIEIWGRKAREMQKQMTEFARGSFVPYFWAVNDVGTCHFILGMSYQKQKNFEKARRMYEAVVKDYFYAQCWDPKGHYWKVAEVSKMNLAEIAKPQP